MKKLGYLLFAFFFWIGRIFPVRQTRVVLFNGLNHGLNGNLLEIKHAMERQQKEKKLQEGSRYSFVFCSKWYLYRNRKRLNSRQTIESSEWASPNT